MQSHENLGLDPSFRPVKTTFSFASIFRRDDRHWDGVPRINIYLLRLLFILMLLFLGKDSWTHIFTFKGTWNPMAAAVLPIVVMPWRYVFRRYISGVRKDK
jgi:hypothetical protein